MQVLRNIVNIYVLRFGKRLLKFYVGSAQRTDRFNYVLNSLGIHKGRLLCIVHL